MEYPHLVLTLIVSIYWNAFVTTSTLTVLNENICFYKNFRIILLTVGRSLNLLANFNNVLKFTSGSHRSHSYRLSFSTTVEKYSVKVLANSSFLSRRFPFSLNKNYFWITMYIFIWEIWSTFTPKRHRILKLLKTLRILQLHFFI